MATLVPMTQAELDEIMPAMTADFARDKVANEHWPEASAPALAAAANRELLPLGVRTENHFLFRVIDAETKKPVGSLWYNERDTPMGREAFIYNIVVDEKLRGQGYGSATMRALEERLKLRGIARLALHVFGKNPRAQKLYRELGFSANSIWMLKNL